MIGTDNFGFSDVSSLKECIGDSSLDESKCYEFNHNQAMAPLFLPMFSMIRQSWHIYPLGVLFGLGFRHGCGGRPFEHLRYESLERVAGDVRLFPSLLRGSMSHVDTCDNILLHEVQDEKIKQRNITICFS
ncbi:hypothetical protein [Granulicella sp. L60]|uniref:HoxN/HupN/NixA family nickel/cobalt transporter n=1 Tax=Granulicella sp. L60 TaxID=1641866 RepID=UPI001C20B3A8|nr:hypothetical protein [Granulicella sp. L60]